MRALVWDLVTLTASDLNSWNRLCVCVLVNGTLLGVDELWCILLGC